MYIELNKTSSSAWCNWKKKFNPWWIYNLKLLGSSLYWTKGWTKLVKIYRANQWLPWEWQRLKKLDFFHKCFKFKPWETLSTSASIYYLLLILNSLFSLIFVKVWRVCRMYPTTWLGGIHLTEALQWR